MNIPNQLRFRGSGNGAAYTSPESNDLTCYLPLEGTKDELIGFQGVMNIESSPVDVIQRRRERVITVPEE